MRFILLSYLVVTVAAGSSQALDLRYWIEPCTRPETHCLAQDPQMAEWALQDWQRASGGALKLEKTPNRLRANIRIFWASANQGLYGEARAFVEDGVKGAEVFVLPQMSDSPDSLLRDAIVYLTCLHETGHALGLAHTDAFPDIMYSFQFGGDIPAYFNRYRRQLKTRDDIPRTTGTSPQDRARLIAALAIY
ncbi:MAG: matrixin family metalloprotease [Acidobacteriota bacterium]